MAFRDALKKPRGGGLDLAAALGYAVPKYRSHKAPRELPYRIDDPEEMTPAERAMLAFKRAP